MLDVGANAGFYSLLGSRLVGRNGRVYSFEPLPANIPILRRHLGLNGAKNVSVFDVAIADFEGTARLDPAANNSMAHLSDSGTLEVQVTSLDRMFADGRITAPRLIKIDVEGAEARVLNGARHMISACRPLLLIATHGPKVHQETVNMLDEMGYCVRGVGSPIISDEIAATPQSVAIGPWQACPQDT